MNLYENLHSLLESGKSIYKLVDETIVYSDIFITQNCRHLKHIFYTLEGKKKILSLGNLAIDITSEYLDSTSIKPITIDQSYECINTADPLNPNASYLGFGCGFSSYKIEDIKFNKYLYDSLNDIKYTINSIYKNSGYLLYKKYIYKNTFNFKDGESSQKDAYYFTIVNSTNYNIHAFVPRQQQPSFSASDSSGSTYIVTVTLKGSNNVNNWNSLIDSSNTYENLNNIYNISVEPSYNKLNRHITQSDFYPKWIYENGLWYYYGGFGYFFNKLVEPSSNITINISNDVVLPFGITSTFFSEILNYGLDLSNLLNQVNNNIIWNPSFDPNKNRGESIVPFTNYNLNQYFPEANQTQIWSYFQSLPIQKAKSIIINGGVISGYILKTSPNPCKDGCRQKDYWTDLRNSRHDNNPKNYRVRMTDPTSYNDWKDMNKAQFIRAVEYWIYSGLLELYSDNITLNGVTVLDGWKRGISPVQLNAYNLDSSKQYNIDTNGKTNITNCQFCLFNNCQVDGLDILSNNVTYKNIYFQASDDVLKLSSSNILANNITIVSGNCGGAINLSSYGTNVHPLTNINITNIFVHGYYKKSTSYGPGVSSIRSPKELNFPNGWGGSAIITAYNLGKAMSNSNSDCSINITNLYVVNNNNLNKNDMLVNNIQGTLTEPGNFLTGEYYNNNSTYTLTINFDNVWYKYLDTTEAIQIDTCSNIYLNSYLYIDGQTSWNKLKFNGIYCNSSNLLPTSTIKKYGYSWAYYPFNQVGSRDGVFTGDSQYTLFQGYNGNDSRNHVQWHQMWLGPNFYTKNTILFKNSCQNDICYKCLDLSGGDTTNGNEVIIWDCNNRLNQQWSYNTSTKQIKYKGESNKNKCLQVNLTSGSTLENANTLEIWDCNINQINQKQTWEGSGNYQWNIPETNYCMDLLGGKTNDGTQVGIWDCLS